MFPLSIPSSGDPLLSLSVESELAAAGQFPAGVPGVLTLTDGDQYGLVPLELLLGGEGPLGVGGSTGFGLPPFTQFPGPFPGAVSSAGRTHQGPVLK